MRSCFHLVRGEKMDVCISCIITPFVLSYCTEHAFYSCLIITYLTLLRLDRSSYCALLLLCCNARFEAKFRGSLSRSYSLKFGCELVYETAPWGIFPLRAQSGRFPFIVHEFLWVPKPLHGGCGCGILLLHWKNNSSHSCIIFRIFVSSVLDSKRDVDVQATTNYYGSIPPRVVVQLFVPFTGICIHSHQNTTQLTPNVKHWSQGCRSLIASSGAQILLNDATNYFYSKFTLRYTHLQPNVS